MPEMKLTLTIEERDGVFLPKFLAQ
jgi:hypothetical protein